MLTRGQDAACFKVPLLPFMLKFGGFHPPTASHSASNRPSKSSGFRTGSVYLFALLLPYILKKGFWAVAQMLFPRPTWIIVRKRKA